MGLKEAALAETFRAARERSVLVRSRLRQVLMSAELRAPDIDECRRDVGTPDGIYLLVAILGTANPASMKRTEASLCRGQREVREAAV